jgi:pimeloyl-ACP methyl ester carboxylesterase
VPEIRVNGIRLHYEERGDGAPIACIHGGGSTALLWSEAVEELARCGRVIAYDRRGCGRSERPEPYRSTTVVEQADDAAGLLAALDATPAVVIARSYGGAVAIEMALRWPDSVRALALLEGDALGLSATGLAWTRRLRDRLRKVESQEGVDAVYAALIAEVMGEGAWETFPAEVRDVLSANGAALLAELDYVDQPMPDAAAVGGIEVPVLLVAAEDSFAEQREMTTALGEAIPHARTEIVSGGHLIDPAAPEVTAFVEHVLRIGE